MREVVFRNLSSALSKKKDISIEENICQDGVVSKTEKRSRYFVRNIIEVDTKEDFEKWMNEKKNSPEKDKRWFHILKQHSDAEHKDKVLCKARGVFYAIVGKKIYNIVFVHSVKMEISLL